MTTLVQLSAAVQPLIRGAGAVQFGLDAADSAVVAVSRPARLVAALSELRTPRPAATALAALADSGLDAPAARTLLADLLAVGVLRRVEPGQASVVLIGRTRLAEALSGLLTAAGVRVRRPLRGESEHAYLAGAPVGPQVPVVVVDRIAHARSLAPTLLAHSATFLPVDLVGDGGWIGPLHHAGAGPCPLCVDLHRAERDPLWLPLVAQLPAGPPAVDPVAAAATAAHAAAWARDLAAQAGPEKAGPRATALRAGQFVAVAPDRAPRPALVSAHPRCPACWAVSSGKIRRARVADPPRISPP